MVCELHGSCGACACCSVSMPDVDYVEHECELRHGEVARHSAAHLHPRRPLPHLSEPQQRGWLAPSPHTGLVCEGSRSDNRKLLISQKAPVCAMFDTKKLEFTPSAILTVRLPNNDLPIVEFNSGLGVPPLFWARTHVFLHPWLDTVAHHFSDAPSL